MYKCWIGRPIHTSSKLWSDQIKRTLHLGMNNHDLSSADQIEIETDGQVKCHDRYFNSVIILHGRKSDDRRIE